MRQFNPEQEVPSLELCKRLKELGYPQEGGGWYWVDLDKPYLTWYGIADEPPDDYYIKAPTVRELGEWLPVDVKLKEGDAYLQMDNLKLCGFKTTIRLLSYCLYNSHFSVVIIEDATEPNARAKMLIWLAENGYIKFTEDK